MDNYEDRDPDPTFPVCAGAIPHPKGSDDLETMTVTRIVTPTPTIGLIANIFPAAKDLKGSEGRKALTVTSIATPTLAIPVTVAALFRI